MRDIEVVMTQDNRPVVGIVSGQALMALADTAMVLALCSALARSVRWSRST